jgi:hypothetical protein
MRALLATETQHAAEEDDEVYHERFETEDSEDHATAGTYSVVREAERIVEESR